MMEASNPASEDPGPYSDAIFAYYAKLIIPAFEFASMFVVLLGMLTLPLTMCRYLANKLSQTAAARWLPLNHLVQLHSFIGACFVLQNLVIFILFMCYLGVMCRAYGRGDEPSDYCRGTHGGGAVTEDGVFFTSEIFSTGYAIVAMGLIIMVPAIPWVRKRISYEWFYGLHQTFIPLYAVCIAHTFDPKGRAQWDSRIQVFLWCIVPVVLYTYDRSGRNATIESMRVTSIKVLAAPAPTLFLRLAKPPGWEFLVGQYVKLCVPEVSSAEYHPFTIASSPTSNELEFIIRVIESDGKGGVMCAGRGGTWTERVYKYFQTQAWGADNRVHVKVEGPYGSVMQSVFNLPNVALLASGTGIVPMLSAIRELYATDKFGIKMRRHTTHATHALPTTSNALATTPNPMLDAHAAAPLQAGFARAPAVGAMLNRVKSTTAATAATGVAPGGASATSQSAASTEGAGAMPSPRPVSPAASATVPVPNPYAGVPPPPAGPPALVPRRSSSLASKAPAPEGSLMIETTYAPGISVDEEKRRRMARRAWRTLRSFVLTAKGRRSLMAAIRYSAAMKRGDVRSVRFISGVTPSTTVKVAPSPAANSGMMHKPPAPTPAPVDALKALLEARQVNSQFYRAATQYPLFFGASLLLAVLQFLLVCLEVSFYSSGLGNEVAALGRETNHTWPILVLDILSSIAVFGFVVFILVQPRFTAESSTYTYQAAFAGKGAGPRILSLIVATAQMVMIGGSFGEARPWNGLVFSVLCLLRCYTMLWHYASNPLFLIAKAENSLSMRRGAAFMSSANLIWVNRGARSFLALAEELADISDDIAFTCGADFLTVSCYITGETTDAERTAVHNAIYGTSLQGCVHFKRPDVPAFLDSVCASLAPQETPQSAKKPAAKGKGKGSAGSSGDSQPSLQQLLAEDSKSMLKDPSLNVFVCGTQGLAGDVREAVLEARTKYRGKVVLAFGAETVFG